MEWVTPFALLCHNTQSPLCLFLIKHQPQHKPTKHHCYITHIDGHENERDENGMVKWMTWKHTKQSHPSTLHPSFQPSSITLPFHSFKNTRFMFAVLHNCHCLLLRCEEEKSGDVNHVLFGKDDEATDGG